MALPSLVELGFDGILGEAKNADGKTINVSLVRAFVAHRADVRARKICAGLPLLHQSIELVTVQSIEKTALEELLQPDILMDLGDLELTIESFRRMFENEFNSSKEVAIGISNEYEIDGSLPSVEQLALASKLYLLRVLNRVRENLPDIVSDAGLLKKIQRNLDRTVIHVYLEGVNK